MVSRTTDDYEQMARAGCVAITEPAFWAGFDRSSARGFHDYFRHLTDFERQRAASYGIRHHTWMAMNPKESEDLVLAREVLSIIPEFLDKPSVLGIGEIGLNKNSRNELTVFEEHLEIAREHRQLVLIHTPHLEDKLKGTRLIMDAVAASGLDHGRVLIDHVEEHTVGTVLERGFWAAMTLYPETKCTPQRAADIFETYGTERLFFNSAGDWGPSDPLAVPKALLELRRRGHPEETLRKVSFDNPLAFLNQSGKFRTDGA
jgi:predicted metal-dependent TIM-barrel fold hydrolase